MVGVMACQQKSPCSSNSILDYKGFLFSGDSFSKFCPKGGERNAKMVREGSIGEPQ
jgi:hypothetical protein